MKIRNLTIFTVAVTLLSVAARTATLLYATAEGTGFFIGRLAALGIALSVAVFLLTAICFSFAFAVKEKAVVPFTPSFVEGIACVILGITLIAYSLGFNAHSYIFPWQHILEAASGILGGLWFILYGLNFKLPTVTAVLPCLHFVMRLVVVFTSLSTAALVAEHVFSLAYRVSVMVFMLNFGRIVANVPTKNTNKVFFPISCAAVIFTGTSVLSRLIMIFADKTELIHGEAALDITGIVLLVFMLLTAADICKENETKTEEEVNDDLQC